MNLNCHAGRYIKFLIVDTDNFSIQEIEDIRIQTKIKDGISDDSIHLRVFMQNENCEHPLKIHEVPFKTNLHNFILVKYKCHISVTKPQSCTENVHRIGCKIGNFAQRSKLTKASHHHEKSSHFLKQTS